MIWERLVAEYEGVGWQIWRQVEEKKRPFEEGDEVCR